MVGYGKRINITLPDDFGSLFALACQLSGD